MGVCTASRKVETTQMRVGKILLGANNTVVGVAVQGDQGWRKLEGRDEDDVR